MRPAASARRHALGHTTTRSALRRNHQAPAASAHPGGCARGTPVTREATLATAARPRGAALVCASTPRVLSSAASTAAAGQVHSATYAVGDGCHVTVTYGTHGDAEEPCFHVSTDADQLWLHWGVVRGTPAWTLPPPASWPAGSRNHKDRAVQTPLTAGAPVRIAVTGQPVALEFVVFDASGRWFNPQHGDARASWRFDCHGGGALQAAAAPPPASQPSSPTDAMRALADTRMGPPGARCTHEWVGTLGGTVPAVARVLTSPDKVTLAMVVRAPPGVAPSFVHWGVCDGPASPWLAPPYGWSTNPPRSADGTGGAWNTELDALGDDLFGVAVSLPAAARARGLVCVLAMSDGQWLKSDSGGDLFIPFPVDSSPQPSAAGKPPKAAAAPKSASPPWDAAAAAAAEVLPTASVAAALVPIVRAPRSLDTLRTDTGGLGTSGAGAACDERMVNAAAEGEANAHKSLMHRFRLAAELLGKAESDGEVAMVALFTWLRYFATRQVVWNKNYNVKPREISAAQNALTAALCRLHRSRPDLRDVVRLSMACIGRGGTGDMGQRIRDEILDIQQATGMKGGMMEEWHQKLHNNTSPDDVVICEALLAYLATPDLNVAAYWARLAKDGITAERLQSYDRAIRSQPNFPPDKRASLTKALTEYLRTLKAVHSGADLASAADAVLGYRQASSQGVAIHNPPLPGVATPHLRQLLHTAQAAAGVAAAAAASGDAGASQGKKKAGSSLTCTEALVLACEAIVEARHELRPWTKAGGAAVPDGRDADVLYLDQGLETALRTACEACLSVLTTRPASDVITVTGLALENLALSAGSNSELVLCLKEWRAIEAAARGDAADKAGDKQPALWPLRAKAAADRLRLALSSQGERYTLALAAPAAALGSRLGVSPHTVALFPEEVVRGTSAAPVAQLLRVLEPRLRELANLGAWQVISPVQAAGQVVCVPTLGEVASRTFEQPTVLVASHVSGDEDIAGSVVAVFTPDAPDVLSHVSVRARNEGVLFATVYDSAVFDGLKAMAGQHVSCTPSQDGSNVVVTPGEAPTKQQQLQLQSDKKQGGGGVARIVQRPFKGQYAVPSVAFTPETVGGKSRNLNGLRRVQLPAGVRLPAGAALAFGAFDQALNDGCNSAVRADLTKRLAELKRLRPDDAGHDEVLASIRGCVARMAAPKQLRDSLKQALSSEGIPVPGEAGGTGTWEEAWGAITTVWASKWNSRAVTACAKAGLNHGDISMAVLVQEHVPARLSFVLHTTNPVNGSAKEVYGELVVGLGDTLVGASPGRALSFSVPKGDGTAAGVGQPTLLGFPSKPLGLFNPVRTLIFRSDSNGEDLEGYAGAGLYDSVAMHLPREAAVDYASEQVMCDAAFCTALLQRIAQAGVVAEQALGGPQDIEGCVTADAEVIIVQTRPQV